MAESRDDASSRVGMSDDVPSKPAGDLANSQSDSVEEIADGMALWQEHRPQSPEDWIAVARRCNADPSFDRSRAAPMLVALCIAVEEVDRA